MLVRHFVPVPLHIFLNLPIRRASMPLGVQLRRRPNCSIDAQLGLQRDYAFCISESGVLFISFDQIYLEVMRQGAAGLSIKVTCHIQWVLQHLHFVDILYGSQSRNSLYTLPFIIFINICLFFIVNKVIRSGTCFQIIDLLVRILKNFNCTALTVVSYRHLWRLCSGCKYLVWLRPLRHFRRRFLEMIILL